MKKIWNEINCIIGKQRGGNIEDTIQNFLGKTFESNDILSAFVKEFSTGVNEIIHSCTLSVSDYSVRNRNCATNVSIYIPKITEINVLKIITNMKSSKSPGIDLIRIQDIKHCKNQIAPMIVELINISLKSGIIPDTLKISIIRPIYKGGVHTDFKNYRPIAILPVIEKIMESYIATKLNRYLKTFKIINEEQHGFQSGKSTVSLLENYTEYVNSKLNTNKLIITIFIDLKKAFDTINHNILIQRLEEIGIQGEILNWFINYLKNRKITVMINNQFSEITQINVGIPQGSILGPTLYTIYVNPVFQQIQNCKMYMYADDTALVIANNDREVATRLLQDDFNIFQTWIHDNQLTINVKKTKVLCIKTP